MKITAKGKQPFKAKPGQLLRTVIEYGDGDSASVHHEHEPEPQRPGQPWSPGATPLKKHFSTRTEAHHHAAQQAGVDSEFVGDGDEDDEDIEPMDRNIQAGMAPGATKSKKPPYPKKAALVSGEGTAGKQGIPPRE